MTLIEYLKSIDVDAAKIFASSCGTTLGQIRQVAHGNRRAGESLAINIERETGGLVRCEDMRPDVDWAYLRNSRPVDKAA